MKLATIRIKQFKRFNDFIVEEIPQKAKLVILTGPNGSGKSSLFEAFNFWAKLRRNQGWSDPAYFARENSFHESFIRDSLQLVFHDFAPDPNTQNNKKCFYIRSAYRHEADFTTNGLSGVEDILNSMDRTNNLLFTESRISENYNRIIGEAVKELFNGTEPNKPKHEIIESLVGEVRKSMFRLFDSLILQGTGNPTSNGTFLFNKGPISGFHYKNLSGGEKAAFDLLLDFIVKKQTFNNTIYCIDEPELHMHTRLQGKLLEELFSLLPDNCQLWISTHSIGMARKAFELYKDNPDQVVFIDFHGHNFDDPVALKPINPDRGFWKNMFYTALDDLSELVVPNNVVFCEGKKIGLSGRNPSFDASVYSQIFSNKYPDTEFIPLGGTNEIQTNGKFLGSVVLKKLAPGIKTWGLFDQDDRSSEEIAELNAQGIHVLRKRDLESYLWEDEIIDKLASSRNLPLNGLQIKTEKNRLLSNTNPIDDIKAISGILYNFCKTNLSITQGGNNAEAFARDTLAKLVTPDTNVYKELEQIIFTQ